MFVDGLPVLRNVLARAAVSGAAFHNGAIHLLHEVADKRRLEVVVVATFSGGDFYGHSALGLHAQCFIDFDQ